MKPGSAFNFGLRSILPITTGIIPFGAVVGTLCSEAKFSFFQTMSMNLLVYAGASQLAATELMMQNAAGFIVVATGLVINLRFILYSAAISPLLSQTPLLTKVACAFTLTDQSYAVMSAHQHKLKTKTETLSFYFGTAACMMLVWNSSVVAGFVFGNFAPATWALDYAVPLSFIALVIPTLKNKYYFLVAVFSSVTSILLSQIPYRLGLVLTAVLAVGFGAILIGKKAAP
ncbi:MAG: AzlC family ABC transporter permease [Bdellovibrio sp.]